MTRGGKCGLGDRVVAQCSDKLEGDGIAVGCVDADPHMDKDITAGSIALDSLALGGSKVPPPDLDTERQMNFGTMCTWIKNLIAINGVNCGGIREEFVQRAEKACNMAVQCLVESGWGELSVSDKWVWSWLGHRGCTSAQS